MEMRKCFSFAHNLFFLKPNNVEKSWYVNVMSGRYDSENGNYLQISDGSQLGMRKL